MVNCEGNFFFYHAEGFVSGEEGESERTCLPPAPLIRFPALLPSLSCGWLRTVFELLYYYYPAKESRRGGLEIAIHEHKSSIPSGPKAILGTVNLNYYRSVIDHEAPTPESVGVAEWTD